MLLANCGTSLCLTFPLCISFLYLIGGDRGGRDSSVVCTLRLFWFVSVISKIISLKPENEPHWLALGKHPLHTGGRCGLTVACTFKIFSVL